VLPIQETEFNGNQLYMVPLHAKRQMYERKSN